MTTRGQVPEREQVSAIPRRIERRFMFVRGTIMVGMDSMGEFEAALAAALLGPLPAEALRRVAELTAGLAGEKR